jgi:flagellar protein FliS
MSPYINNGCNYYQASDVKLASPEGLIVLLYAEFLCCLVASKEAFLTEDDATRNKNMSKAVEILVELIGSLDMKKGEKIASFLAMLYEYIAVRLFLLRREPTVERFDEVITLITPLKEAWEIISSPNTHSKIEIAKIEIA